MTQTTAIATVADGQTKAVPRGFIWRIAWRNLWRNRRRTWLTAGGIAFAILLVSAGMALQGGSYQSMIETATGFYVGQLQLSHQDFVEDQKLEQTITDATQLTRAVGAVPGLKVAPRTESFALVSAGERSFGGLAVGVDFAAEQQVVNFFNKLHAGSLPDSDDEVVIGVTMARNLGADIGDELVLLGTAKEGGVAASALRISALFSSGQAELDRTLLFAHLATMQNTFALGDEIHKLVVSTDDPAQLDEVQKRLQALVPDPVLVRTWPQFMPEVVQAIEFDRISALLMYGAILALVTFSVVNTFLMVVFERNREFGMLLALGMRPYAIISQVLAEAFFVWCVGVLCGLSLSTLLVGYFMYVGIPVAGMEELAEQFYVFDRIYPRLSLVSLGTAPVVLLLGTQIAALLATWRIRRIQPVSALRSD
ncbi:MAG: FtsX-like permease family protein [Pseudomonadota bacterium]